MCITIPLAPAALILNHPWYRRSKFARNGLVPKRFAGLDPGSVYLNVRARLMTAIDYFDCTDLWRSYPLLLTYKHVTVTA